MFTHAHTNANTDALTHTDTHKQTQIHKHAHMHANTHRHRHRHTHAHTRTHTHTQTHTLIHTQGADSDKAALAAVASLKGLPQRFDDAQLQISQLTASRNTQVSEAACYSFKL